MSLLSLYVIGDPGAAPVKVGISRDPDQRLLALRGLVGKTAEVLFRSEPMAKARTVERIAHALLRDYEEGEEMFRVLPEVAIATIERAQELAASGDTTLLDRERIHVSLDPDMRSMLEDYRRSHRPIPSSAGAARLILRAALSAWKNGEFIQEPPSLIYERHD